MVIPLSTFHHDPPLLATSLLTSQLIKRNETVRWACCVYTIAICNLEIYCWQVCKNSLQSASFPFPFPVPCLSLHHHAVYKKVHRVIGG